VLRPCSQNGWEAEFSREATIICEMQLHSLGRELKSDYSKLEVSKSGIQPVAVDAVQPHLDDPRVVLSLLEADQVVAAKEHMRFGPQKLSRGVRAMLWCLRVYVVVMLIIVFVSVLRAFHVVH
jgi:hypothetical protein